MSGVRQPALTATGPSDCPPDTELVGWPRKQSEAERKLEELQRILNEDKGDLAGLGTLWSLIAWLARDRIEQLRRIDEAAK